MLSPFELESFEPVASSVPSSPSAVLSASSCNLWPSLFIYLYIMWLRSLRDLLWYLSMMMNSECSWVCLMEKGLFCLSNGKVSSVVLVVMLKLSANASKIAAVPVKVLLFSRKRCKITASILVDEFDKSMVFCFKETFMSPWFTYSSFSRKHCTQSMTFPSVVSQMLTSMNQMRATRRPITLACAPVPSFS